jgi:hypothetical protein
MWKDAKPGPYLTPYTNKNSDSRWTIDPNVKKASRKQCKRISGGIEGGKHFFHMT